MHASRRTVLGLGGGIALASLLGVGGCGTTAGGEAAALRFTWWGNDVRNKATAEVIDAYQRATPGVTISGEPTDPASYWDRLATQTAANDLPDLVQMDEKYIREYGDRGALLDLSDHDIDVSGFADGVAANGLIEGSQFGWCGGTNTPVLLANPSVFETYGIEVPDDLTWTWDDLRAVAVEVSRAGAGEAFGTGAIFSNEAVLSSWLRQQDLNVFSADGLGFEVADVAGYFEMLTGFMTDGALPPAAMVTEEVGKPIAEGMFATGRVGFAAAFSNQVKAFDTASGEDIALLRIPSLAGSAQQRKAWYKASMYWSVSARTDHPEQATAFIDWLLNSPEAGGILLTERGLTPDTDVLAAIQSRLDASDTKVAAFMAAIEPEVTDPPPPPVVGGGRIQDVLTRHVTDLMFGRQTTASTAEAFVAELTADITR